MKKILFIFFVLFFVLTNQEFERKKIFDQKNNHPKTNSDLYILKNTGNYRNNIFSPVLIYKKTNIRNNLIFMGVGSLFEFEGEGYIVTSEHLFDKNDPSAFYLYKEIFTENSGDIEEIMLNGYELTNKETDVILLKTGKSKKIRGIYEGKNIDKAKLDVTNKTNSNFLKSLISGKNIEILGKAFVYKRDEIEYLVIDYTSIKGESGTGFVDEQNNIYILKGTIEDDGKKMCVVYGPLSF